MQPPLQSSESSSVAPGATDVARLLPAWLWRAMLYGLLVPAVAVVLLQMLLPRSLDKVNPHWPGKFWKPIILNPEAYLPKINRDLFTVSVQPFSTELPAAGISRAKNQSRVWVGGEEGYLADTPDNGLHWDCLTFEAGRFNKQQPCEGDQAVGAGLDALRQTWTSGWLARLPAAPIVYAAQSAPSKLPNQSPIQSAPSKLPPSAGKPSPSQIGSARGEVTRALPFSTGPLTQSANTHDFGRVEIGQFKSFSVTLSAFGEYQGEKQGATVGGFKFPGGDGGSVFKLTGTPCSRVLFDSTCTLEVLFEPPGPGVFTDDLTFSVTPLQQSLTNPPIVYRIHLRGEGIASGTEPAQKTLPQTTPGNPATGAAASEPIASPGDIVSISWQSPLRGQLVMTQSGPSRLFVTEDGGQNWTPFQPLQVAAGSLIPEQEAIRHALRIDDPCPVQISALSYQQQVAYVMGSMDQLGRPSHECRFTVDTKETRVNALAWRGETQIWAVGGGHGAGAITRIGRSTGSVTKETPLTWAATGRIWHFGMELPAPWFWATLVLAGVFLWAAQQGPPPPLPPGIDNTAVSDRPLQPDDLDSMRLRAVADGISRFFRNPNTSAPLVLCINGGWGSGKSSLMNLLADDLRHSVGQKHRVIAFNAWHHQTEEQVLASLLQSIRVNALKAPWTPSGAWYRLRIFVKRWPQRWFVSVAFCLSTLWTVDVVKDLLQSNGITGASSIDGLKLLTSVPAVLTAFVTLRQLILGFTGFLSNPAVLLSSDGKGSSPRQLEAQTTVRQIFADDFKTVTEVLGNGRLVILIDDLDRCQPEKIREIIEAINFLVTAGDCYIVLGMARDLVEHYLGHSFKKSIKTMPAELLGLSKEQANDAPTREGAFARLYLEKMIQLQFTLRPLGEDQAVALFENSSAAPRSGHNAVSQRITDDRTKATTMLDEAATRKLLEIERTIRNTLRAIELWFLPVVGSVLLVVAGVMYLPDAATTFGTRVKPYIHSAPPPAPITVVWAGPGAATVANPKTTIATSGSPDAGAVSPAANPSSSGSTTQSTPAITPAETTAAGPGTGTSATSSQKAAGSDAGVGVPIHDAIETALPTDAMLVSASTPGKLQILLVCTGLALALWFAGRWWLVSIPAAESAEDSQSFMTALRIWAPFLLSMCKTPRGLKQFLNHVRFLAMLQRAETQPSAPGSQQTALRKAALFWVARRDLGLRQRIEENLAARSRGQFSSDQLIPDSLLVALAAIDARPGLYRAILHANWFEKDTEGILDEVPWGLLRHAFDCTAQAEFGPTAGNREVLAEALRRHRPAFCLLNGGDDDLPEPVEQTPVPPV